MSKESEKFGSTEIGGGAWGDRRETKRVRVGGGEAHHTEAKKNKRRAQVDGVNSSPN